ncbi:MAG: acetate--CoA ligase family protein [Smithellaceae bacterium]|nr:acetate--CoA ligase family protein [Smithellaceae bacterium]
MDIIAKVQKENRNVLSEYESKLLLAAYGIPVTKELLVESDAALASALQEVGYPLVMKGCSSEIAHKTEKGLIRIDIRGEAEAKAAFGEIMAAMNGAAGAVLVQEMVRGQRELVVGMTRDPQFGPCVMFGLGGIFTEILRDVSFRKAPLEKRDALQMMGEIKGKKILEAIRGMEAADLEALAAMLINVGRVGLENATVKEIDINPVILSKGKPVAVDALVVLI